ncbi:unnamed protein product [Urochloa humidicola]
MASRNTRSSANKQRSAASINELELDDSTNVNACEEDIEANVEASGAVDDLNEVETPTGGTSSTKGRRKKKRRTSQVWLALYRTPPRGPAPRAAHDENMFRVARRDGTDPMGIRDDTGGCGDAATVLD